MVRLIDATPKNYKSFGEGKTAAAHPFKPDLVITPDKGEMPRRTAENMGYAVPSPEGIERTKRDARAEQFANLPEAAGKVHSAMRLAFDHPTMTAEQARGFLRGAPTDAVVSAQRRATQPTTQGSESMSHNSETDEAVRRAARRADLARTMRGHMGRRVEASAPAAEPEAKPQAVDRDARRAELSTMAKGLLARR